MHAIHAEYFGWCWTLEGRHVILLEGSVRRVHAWTTFFFLPNALNTRNAPLGSDWQRVFNILQQPINSNQKMNQHGDGRNSLFNMFCFLPHRIPLKHILKDRWRAQQPLCSAAMRERPGYRLRLEEPTSAQLGEMTLEEATAQRGATGVQEKRSNSTLKFLKVTISHIGNQQMCVFFKRTLGTYVVFVFSLVTCQLWGKRI